VPSSEFNRLNHAVGLLLSKAKGGELGARPTVHPNRISLIKTIAEVGLTHEPCPLRQNHVIINSDNAEDGITRPTRQRRRRRRDFKNCDEG
jgi:hypothetical protein